MSRVCITYLKEPERDRWVPGDRWVRPVVRRIVRGRPRPGGLDKVFINLKLGLDRLGVPYEVNLPYRKLRPDDLLGVLGRGHSCLEGYERPERFVAGIGLMTHPSEWPTLFEDYPVACYLQHSEWAAAVYRRHFGNRCPVWPVGIDTQEWQPRNGEKTVDFLVYDKVRWDRTQREAGLIHPILDRIRAAGYNHRTFRYGEYAPEEYRDALQTSRAMIFLCSHESQGIACGEALSAGVPIFAWDPGYCMDPERFRWGEPEIPSTSVPYFDARCGRRFADYADFERQLPEFIEALRGGRFAPRDYIMENLTVEKCSRHFVDLLHQHLG